MAEKARQKGTTSSGASPTGKRGRPSAFDPKCIEQTKKLAAFGANDREIAAFFEVSEATLTEWKSWSSEFAAACIPEPDWRERRVLRTRAANRSKNAYKRARRRANPSERIRNAVSARLYAAVKGRSDGALFSRLGYSSDQLRIHLEAQFQPGMAWENYGRWHIDHRRPVSSFDLTHPAQFEQCWSLSNLQPLWAHDNLVKGARYARP